MLDSRALESWLKLTIGLVLLLLLNLLSSHFFFRLDLTEDKRYTIKEPTKDLLRELEGTVYVDVYLSGDMPAGFERLQTAIRETLEEFEVYAGPRLQYNFVDPLAAKSRQAQTKFLEELAAKGVQATDVFDTEDGKRISRRLVPGAVLSYKGQEKGVLFLKGNQALGPDEQLNQSIEGLEYEIASAIHDLARSRKRRIALLQGHGELSGADIAAARALMQESYEVKTVTLGSGQSLQGYDALVIAKPETPFGESELFAIDQFIMGGGKALVFADALRVNMDSAGGDGTVALPYQTGLNDLLFRYGVRINDELVMDLSAGTYPVVAGNFGDQGNVIQLPWPFHPVANIFGDHPIVKNSDALTFRFVNTLDTVKATGVRKQPLVMSSPYTRILASPVTISFNDFRQAPEPSFFQDGSLPFAYLLEGNFTSLWKNRLLPPGADKARFRESSPETSILVVADGDFIRNEINVETGEPLPLGLEQFSRKQFGNADFLRNALSYMLDEQGLIEARVKEVKIRPLDKVKVEEESSYWQAFNIVSPLVLLLLYGLFRYLWRRNRYAKQKKGDEL